MSSKKYTGPFNSFVGGFNVGAGFKPDGTSGFPLIESCDIQIDEAGNRLDYALNQIWEAINNGGSPLPREVYTETEMTALLTNATTASVGAVYKYMGTTTDTYTQGGLYIIQEE